MEPNAGIASRTRRKRDAYLLSLLYGGSSGDSSQGKTGGKKRRRRMQAHEPDAVFLGEKVGEGEKAERVSGGGEATATASAAGASSSSSKSKGGLKAKREAANDDVVCLGESVDERESGEQRRESFVALPPKEVIEIVDSDDNDTDNAPKEGMKRSEDAVDEGASGLCVWPQVLSHLWT